MSLDQAEGDYEPNDGVELDTRPRGDTITAAPNLRRLAYTLFLGEAAASFDVSPFAAVHESKVMAGEIVVHAAILDDAHVVRVLDHRGRTRFVELFGYAIADGRPTRRVRYGEERGIGLEAFDASGLAVHASARSSIGRVGGWRGVSHPGDRAHALALAHCHSTTPCAPRTVVGVTVDRIDDTTPVRIDAVHEYATRGAINVIACETTLRIRVG